MRALPLCTLDPSLEIGQYNTFEQRKETILESRTNLSQLFQSQFFYIDFWYSVLYAGLVRKIQPQGTTPANSLMGFDCETQLVES